MKGHKPQYIPGDYWMVCDECGFDYRRSEMKKRWDGCLVCKNDWEPKHPQLLVRANRDRIRVSVSRPSYDSQIGSDLLGTAVVVGTGWTDNGSGVFTCDGTQTENSHVVWTSQLSSGSRYRLRALLTSYTNGIARVFSPPGDNIITNGTFDADTNWTKGVGWSIADGVASSDGTQVVSSNLTTEETFERYNVARKYTFTVSNCVADEVQLFTGNVSSGKKSVDGTYEGILYEPSSLSGSSAVAVVADADFVGDVDNVEVYDLETTGADLDTGDMSFKGNYGLEADYDGSSGLLVLRANTEFIGTISIKVYEVT